MESCYHRSNYELYIKQSNIKSAGLGVFTRDIIQTNSYIDSYYGEIIEAKFYGSEYFYRIDDYYGIDAKYTPRCYMAMLNDASYKPTSKRKLKKFVNHNFTNNCKFVVDVINKRIDIFSTRIINSDEELFISYGEEYWKK